jgi:PTS system nitrogen regulatory IIA component
MKREELGSTGTGAGIAIPHARLPGVTKPFGMLVRLATAIDFDAIDGRPVDIVCLLLLPTHAQGSSSMPSPVRRGRYETPALCATSAARGTGPRSMTGWREAPPRAEAIAMLRRTLIPARRS